MLEDIRYDTDRHAWILSGDDIDERYQIVVPRDFVEDENGGPITTKGGEDWVKLHLSQILGAYTARTEGGWVKEPWNRVLVEVID